MSMKKLILLMFIIAIVSCNKNLTNKENNSKDLQTLDINLKTSLDTRATEVDGEMLYTPYELVRMQNILISYSDGRARGFEDNQRDTINNKLMMYAIDIYDPQKDGLNERRLKERNIYFVNFTDYLDKPQKVDTVAYIPNSVLEKAERDIREAYSRNDFKAMYKLFKDAYTAIPTTGKQFREYLKEHGVSTKPKE